MPLNSNIVGVLNTKPAGVLLAQPCTVVFGRAVEDAINLDRIISLRVMAQKFGGLGALGVECAFPSGNGEGGGADEERGHDFDILRSKQNPS